MEYLIDKNKKNAQIFVLLLSTIRTVEIMKNHLLKSLKMC